MASAKLFGAVLFFVSIACAAGEEQPPKAPQPSADDQKAASAVVAEVYRSDYEKAKTPAQRSELAKKLLTESSPTNSSRC